MLAWHGAQSTPDMDYSRISKSCSVILEKIILTEFGSNLIAWLSKNAKPQDMLKGKNTIASLEKLFLAALLLHSGLWTDANTMIGGEVTPDISQVWRHLLKFRNWIRQERQSY